MTPNKRYTRIVNLSFRAKMYLLFGTPNFLRAFFGLRLKPVPLSGFEYQFET
jgi:hypothetical protein